jgi:transposase InsO family protein
MSHNKKSATPRSTGKNNNKKQHEQSSDSDDMLDRLQHDSNDYDSKERDQLSVIQQLQQQLLQQQKMYEQQQKTQQILQQQITQLLDRQTVKHENASSDSQQQPSSHQLRPELYGVPQQSSLGEAPKFNVGDRFATWKQQIEAFVGSHGLDPLVTKSPDQSWNDAKALRPASAPLSTLQQWYLQAGKRVVYAISLAVIKAGLDRDQLLDDARIDKPNNGVVVIDSMHIDVDANPYLIMQTLRDKYDTKTPYAAINIWKKLLAIRWDRTKDKGSKHLQSVRDLFTQLDRLVADDRPKNGECFGETMKAIILLNTLPTSLATDVKILTTQDKIMVAQVESLVRKYDDLQPNTTKSDGATDKANAFAQEKQQHRNKRSRSSKQSQQKSKQPSRFNRANKHHKHRQSNDESAINEGDCLTLAMFETSNNDEDETDTDTAIVAAFSGECDSRTIILDSGATRHLWSQSSDVTDIETLDNPIRMMPAVGRSVLINKIGTVKITPTIKLGEVAIVPQAHVNLMSAYRIAKAGYRIVIDGHEAYVCTRTNNKVLLKFTAKDGLYTRETMQKHEPNKPRKYTDGFQVQKPEPTKPIISSVVTNKPKASDVDKQQTDKKEDVKSKEKTAPKHIHNKQASHAPNKPATIATLYDTMLHIADVESDSDKDVNVRDTAVNDPLAHERFGHQSCYPNTNCEVCLATRTKRERITRKPYKSTTQPLGTINADLIGPFSAMIDGQRQQVPSQGGNLYILVVIDEHTRYSWVHLLRRKSDTAAQLINLLTLLKRQHDNYPIRRLHTDGGSEFNHRSLNDYLASEGIHHTCTTRDKPSHNGKCERFNQTLIAMIRSMLHGCQAHPSLWGEAATQACYTYNRTPLKVISNNTPYELLNGNKPNLSNAYYAINENERSKIQPTSHKGAWLGWDERKNGNRILVNAEGHVIVTRDVKLVETKFNHLAEIMGAQPEPAELNDQPIAPTSSNDDCDDIEPIDNNITTAHDMHVEPDIITQPSSSTIDQHHSDADADADDNDVDSDNQHYTDDYSDGSDADDDDTCMDSTTISSTDSSEPDGDADTGNFLPLNSTNPPIDTPLTTAVTTRSGRVSKPVVRYGTVAVGDLDIDDQRRLLTSKMLTIGEILPEPQSYAAALKHPEAAQFKQAAAEEIANMATRGVYELVPYHPSMNVIRSRWVFKVKRDQHNMPVKYKARLVAKGFQQKKGIDYFETFAPVVKNKSMRIVFALAVHYRLCVKQIDFVTAFLNADLEETIYMHQPEGFEVRDNNGHKLVWRLKKALYGLKQAPRQWNDDIDSTLIKFGYESTIL